VTLSSTAAKHQPALDESSFQQLLAAAYVVQQHNENLRPNVPDSGASQVLSAIAEIQSLIRTRGLGIPTAATLIAERLLLLTRATGISISLITDGYLDCVAEAGTPAKVPGSCVSSHSLVATERLKAGSIFESDNSQTDMRLDIKVCREVGVGSLIAAPVHRFGDIAGLVEVRWNQPVGFGDNERRTCRLFAGLMTGTLERSVRIGNIRTTLADEAPPSEISNEAAVNAAETSLPGASVPEPQTILPASPAEVEPSPQIATPEPNPTCRVCGRPFGADETFCGFCSMPRVGTSPSEDLQSKWASLWYMQRAKGALQEADGSQTLALHGFHNLEPASRSEGMVVPAQAPSAEPTPLMRVLRARPERENFYLSTQSVTSEDEAAESDAPFPFAERPPIWERTTHFATRRWRDIVLICFVTLLAYGLLTAWPKSRLHLTWFQSLMVRLGISHTAVAQPAFAGDPDIRVWIDVHTQLYYCQGADLYGKTPDGEYTTQHNAQSDGYQSASNVTCP
jgi:hypothetical protein